MAMRYQLPPELEPNVGEGISRTSDPHARLWPVTVTFTTGSRPMSTTIRALSAGQAEEFARNRHPAARTVTVGRVPE